MLRRRASGTSRQTESAGPHTGEPADASYKVFNICIINELARCHSGRFSYLYTDFRPREGTVEGGYSSESEPPSGSGSGSVEPPPPCDGSVVVPGSVEPPPPVPGFSGSGSVEPPPPVPRVSGSVVVPGSVPGSVVPPPVPPPVVVPVVTPLRARIWR